jgi:prolyl 4-hydroxylase
MTGRDLDASWQGWVRENLDRKCDPHEMLGILLQHGFDPGSIAAAMGPDFPAGSPLLGSQRTAVADHRALTERPPTFLARRPGLWRLPHDHTQLFTLNGFLAATECERLVDMIKTSLRPSTVTTEFPSDPYFRTSRTCDLSDLHDSFIEAVDVRISEAIGIRGSYGEGLQGQFYNPGEEFKAHTDFFEPGSTEYTQHAATRGNRTWTFMIYLNDVTQGGGTLFSRLGVQIQPRIGQAVIWNNLLANGSPNDLTLHAALPVGYGYKAVVTKWFREIGVGPMFVDT